MCRELKVSKGQINLIMQVSSAKTTTKSLAEFLEGVALKLREENPHTTIIQYADERIRAKTKNRDQSRSTTKTGVQTGRVGEPK